MKLNFRHGRGRCFSSKGIQIAVDYFLQRGHKVKVVVPVHCKKIEKFKTLNPEILDKLYDEKILDHSPSKSYEDRLMVKFAKRLDAVIVSNDQFKDLIQKDPSNETFIKSR